MKNSIQGSLPEHLRVSFSLPFDSLLIKLSASEARGTKIKWSSVNFAAFAAAVEDWAQKRSQMTKIGLGDWWQPASCWILPSAWPAARGKIRREKGIRVNRRMHSDMLNGDPAGDKNQGGL